MPISNSHRLYQQGNRGDERGYLDLDFLSGQASEHILRKTCVDHHQNTSSDLKSDTVVLDVHADFGAGR